MENGQKKFLLGIDGGGTKTEFLLTDIDKNEVRRVVLGASNPVNVGIEKCKCILRDGITAVCDGIPLNMIQVFAGIAGSGSEEIKALLNNFLRQFCFNVVSNGSDTELALQCALNADDGMIVIIGTGVVGFARSNGVVHRIGGWGYMIDKGGSAYHFGADALSVAYEFFDGRGESSVIAELVMKKLGSAYENAITDIYSGGPAFVASFAPIVFEAYKRNDPIASAIIQRNIEEIIKLIAAARNEYGIKRIVFCGGLCKQKDILDKFLKDKIDKSISYEFLDKPMVYGALELAQTLSDKGD